MPLPVQLIFFFVSSFLITFFFYPFLNQLYLRANFLRENYRGELIPLGTGLIFSLSFLFSFSLSIFLWPNDDWFKQLGLVFLLAITMMSLLGLVDDFLGSNQSKGLKGHIRQLLKGELTTGALKAIGGALLSFFLALYFFESYQQLIVVTGIIALSINSINLLDLRPGRAVKGFIIYALFILFLGGWQRTEITFLMMVLGSVLAHFRYDLKAKVMMGDTGSNALGVVLGLTAILVLPDTIKLFLLILLVAFHIFTEKYSLTKVIAGSKILGYLDRLGR